MVEIVKEKRVKLPTKNLGPVKAPRYLPKDSFYQEYKNSLKERDKFIISAQKEINRENQDKKSDKKGMVFSCLGVGGVYSAIKFRVNIKYFFQNLIHALKRKP